MKKNKTDSRRSGYIALLGRTNVGKSTFLNAILQAKVAIVSDRPQTTRKRILGIKTTRRGQMIFFDCPGVHKPHFKLNQLMMKEVSEALLDSDLILYFVSIEDEREDDFILTLLRNAGKPAFLVINKIDKMQKSRILLRIQAFKDIYPWQEIVPVSARCGDNLDLIEDLIFKYLPAGENFYPEDEWTRQSESFYVAELIREKLLSRIRDELPYLSSVQVQEIERKEKLVYVQAEIVVETPAQKKIVIGRQGRLIKEVGQDARRELEDYFGQNVYLDLYAKAVPGWRNSERILRELFG